MKPSSIGVAVVIAASNLSAIALAFSQPTNVANLESKPSQMSAPANPKIAGKICNLVNPLCGWWIIIEDFFS